MLINNKTFCIVTLGCRTNICESNDISNQLLLRGAKRVQNIDSANICVVNTCCVTNKAEAKSRYFINRVTKSNNSELVIIVGCLAQLNLKVVGEKIGIILGSKDKNDIGKWIDRYKAGERIVSIGSFTKNDAFNGYANNDFMNKTRAFIKIQDGCDFMCSYCVIPFVRGRQRSLSHKIILENIQQLVKNGYKELILTGVNTAGYRESDMYGFFELLRDIDKLKGNFRIRISSLEPFQIDNKIIDLITDNKQRWCQQFHICIQSANDQVIRQMKRKYSLKCFMKLCAYIKKRNKLASITTDYIVGFPTETKKQFVDSLKNLKRIGFSDMHIFPFSSRPFTSAAKLKNIVGDYEKRLRFVAVNKLNKQAQTHYLKQFIGKKVNVLFEQSNRLNIQRGHSEYFFCVDVRTTKVLTNKMLHIKITSLIDNQLFGTIV